MLPDSAGARVSFPSSIRDYEGCFPPPELAPEFRLDWRYDDGGRKAAGFPAHGDCGVRAAALATGLSYVEAYRRLVNADELKPRWDGVRPWVMSAVLAPFGFEWTSMLGWGIHLRTDEFPRSADPIVARVQGHLTIVRAGTIHDTFDPSLRGRRSVLGLWQRR